jgi:mRNA interferase MazF
MVDRLYVPKRGDLVWMTLDPQEGHEQAGRRPALVISPVEYNRVRRLAIMCAVTSRIRGGGLEVPLPAGLRIAGVVLVDQIRCMAYRERGAEFIDTAPGSVLDEVLGRLSGLLFGD